MPTAAAWRPALIFATALIALLGAAVAFAPRMIDVRGLAPGVALDLSRALGVDVAIRGDVVLSFVPRPRLTLRDIATTADGEGGLSLSVPEARADLAWRDLVLGRYVVTELRLIRSVMAISPSRIAPLALPRLRIENGRVAIRVGAADVVIDNVTGDLSAAASGAISWAASGAIAGVSIDTEGRLGSPMANDRRNIQVMARLPEADTDLELTGQVIVGPERSIGVEGKAVLSGRRAADGLSAVAGLDIDPARWPWAAADLAVSGAVKLRDGRLDFDDVALRLGEQTAMLSGGLRDWGGAAPRFTFKIDAAKVDALGWLPAKPVTATEQSSRSLSDLWRETGAPWQGDIVVNVPLARLGEQTIRDGRLELVRVDSGWNIRAARATLPGQARLSGSGFVRLDPAGSPGIDGSWQADIQDLRGLLGWVGFDLGAVPPERLATLRAGGTLQASSSLVVLNDLALSLDGGEGKGRIAWSLDGRAPLNVDLALDHLAVDAYAPVLAALSPPRAPAAPSPPASGYGLTPALPGLPTLSGWRAAVRLQVERMTWRDAIAGKLGADIVVADNAVDIRSLAFEDPLTGALWLGGRVEALDAVPTFKGLQVDAKATDIGRVGRILDVEMPSPLRRLGPWTATAVLNGTVVEATLTLEGGFGGVAVKARGTAGVVEGQARIAADIDAAHADADALRRRLWPEQEFAAPLSGGARASAKLALADGQWRLSEIKAAAGPHTLAAEIVADPALKAFTARIVDLAVDARALAPPLPPPLLLPMGWTGEVTVAGAFWRSLGLEARDFSFKLAAAADSLALTDWSGKLFDGAARLAVIWERRADADAPDLKRRTVKGDIAVTGADARAMFGDGRSQARARAAADLTMSFTADGLTADELLAGATGSGMLTLKSTAGDLGKGPLSVLGALARVETAEGAPAGGLEAAASFALENAAVIVTDGKIVTNAYTGAWRGSVDIARRTLDLAGTLKLKDRTLIVGETARLVLPPTVPFAIKGALDAPNVALTAPQ